MGAKREGVGKKFTYKQNPPRGRRILCSVLVGAELRSVPELNTRGQTRFGNALGNVRRCLALP